MKGRKILGYKVACNEYKMGVAILEGGMQHCNMAKSPIYDHKTATQIKHDHDHDAGMDWAVLIPQYE